MPPFSTLPTDQLDALVTFLVDSSKGATVTAAVAEHAARAGGAPRPPKTAARLLPEGGLDPRRLDDVPLLGHRPRASSSSSAAWAGWEPLFKWPVITVVATLTAAPIGFLAGLGAFDYWVAVRDRRADRSRRTTRRHGGRTWQDYFRPNTDHKVIGIQYLVTTIFFFVAGGLMAMLFRAELARPGMQFVDNQTFNGLVSVHAALMIFLFVIPAFAGLGNYVIPLMIGAPDMAFPRLNALSFWLLPIAGTMMLLSFLVPGGAFATGWTSYAPLRDRPAAGAGVLQHGRPVGGRVVDHDRAQLPGHDHHHARAGDDLLAHAAARLGELHDLAAGRDRDAVHRRLAVLRDVRPRHAHELLRRGRAAATCSATSTSSGSTRTRPSTS